MFALLNGKVDIVAGSLGWGLVGASVVVAAWAFVGYPCTACGRFPEAEIPSSILRGVASEEQSSDPNRDREGAG